MDYNPERYYVDTNKSRRCAKDTLNENIKTEKDIMHWTSQLKAQHNVKYFVVVVHKRRYQTHMVDGLLDDGILQQYDVRWLWTES